MSPEETMDTEAQVKALNEALRLQHRSVLMYSVTAGSVVGLEYQAHAEKLSKHALSKLEDARQTGGEDHRAGRGADRGVGGVHLRARPREGAGPADRAPRARRLEALQAAIEPTGREAASEAVEHHLEHMIMRKQEQVDYLLRARRRP